MKRFLAFVFTLSLLWGAASAQELTLLASAGGSGRTFEVAAQHFTEATGIPITVIQYPYAELREKQLLELVSGTGNLDIVSVDGAIWLAELAPYLEPLTDVEVSSLIPSMVDIFTVNDTLYAVPVRIGGWVLIYRQDLFNEAGIEPPQTWDAFLEAAQTLTSGDVYGFAPAFRQGNYLVAQWAPFLYSYGGSILNEDNTAAAFNTPEGITATQFLVDLAREHNVVPPGAVTYEHADVITAMQQGLTAMALTYSPYYLNMNDPEESTVAGNLAVSPFIPYAADSGLETGITLISGWGFGIASDSNNKEAARQFLEFMASPEEQLRLAVENANAPTASAVFEDETYLEAFPAATQVAQALGSARERPGIGQWTTVEDILARELSAAIGGDKTVEEALADAEQAVNETLQ